MKHIRIIILFALLGAFSFASAQAIKIPETNVSFSFPKGGWKYLNTQKVNNNVTVYLYSYSKKYVVDSKGDTTIPFMRVYIHKNYKGTVYDMAMKRYTSQPFQSLDEYPFKDGLGYWGAYTSNEDGKDYLFRMVYLKEGSTGIEIRLETTRDNYNDFDAEFKSILNTIKLK